MSSRVCVTGCPAVCVCDWVIKGLGMSRPCLCDWVIKGLGMSRRVCVTGSSKALVCPAVSV